MNSKEKPLAKKGKIDQAKSTLVATNIKRELKKHFPKIKFKIRSKVYDGGSNATVYYVDGPMPRDVEESLAKFVLGHHDVEKGEYIKSNLRPELPQVHYLFTSREFSDFNIEGTKQAIKKKFKLTNFSEELILKKFGILPDQLLQKVLSSLEFPPREESMREIEKLTMEAQK